MRCWQLFRYEGPRALELVERPDPEPGAGEVVIETRAIGVNFPDLLMTQGRYQLTPPLPFVPGCELAGVVAEAPTGSAWSVGDRVGAFGWQGGYAERVALPADSVVALPDAMSFEDAAALLINHHTAHFSLTRRARLRAGETVLVLGAAGGVGTAAVQVARALGATTVIGGVSAEHRVPIARAAGADPVLVLTEGFAAAVRDLTGGRGVDVVIDPVGDWLFVEATRALAFEGRIVVVGFAAGQIPSIAANRLLLKNISAVGAAWGAALTEDGGLLAEGAAALAQMYAAGQIWPQIGARYGFADLPAALTALAEGQIAGKAIVTLDE